jgi:hypothetical protein
LRIDGDELSCARGAVIKAGPSESINPQSAIRNPQSNFQETNEPRKS